jgi:hypothetical protein
MNATFPHEQLLRLLKGIVNLYADWIDKQRKQ